MWWDDAFGAGLLYMHARHYSPTLGRFLQPDPSAQEANLYGYTENSPVTRTDPEGSCWQFLGVGAALALESAGASAAAGLALFTGCVALGALALNAVAQPASRAIAPKG